MFIELLIDWSICLSAMLLAVYTMIIFDNSYAKYELMSTIVSLFFDLKPSQTYVYDIDDSIPDKIKLCLFVIVAFLLAVDTDIYLSTRPDKVMILYTSTTRIIILI